ncbi:hypothetical protein [Neorhizobium sp. T25_13]|uniref:hypothetical protein n=1 Tax=Neorhizobium sp. T25_13 TaxID=2093830 RepID=UPI000CF87066|nr:hypothetical protein [Neorhizobium sp. T25_13]
MTLEEIQANVVDQDRGRKLEIHEPFEGKPTGMVMWIAGPDSATQRRARIEMMDELAERAEPDGTVTAAHREAARINCLGKCVLRWEVQHEGSDLSFNHKNVVRVLKAADWLQAQVDAFAGDRRNFAPERG